MRKSLKLHLSLIRDLKGERAACSVSQDALQSESLWCMCVRMLLSVQLRYVDSLVCHAVKPVMPRCSVPKSVPVGKPAELHCVEDEGHPKSQYQWFRNKEEIPEDPKTSPKFLNSTYTLNGEMGTLVSSEKEAMG